jgi:manganese/zinc/iron transport system permease protein
VIPSAQAAMTALLLSPGLASAFTPPDYNTRVVVLGVLALGMSSGFIGSFMLLRKRALMADAVSHATLPGIGLAFLFMVRSGGDGKYLPGLLLGALLSGLAGMGAVLWLRERTRIKEDAALGIVLSVFFGFGVALLGMIQKMSNGSAAGLESFIYGKTASMLASDAYLIGGVGAISLLLCLLLFKELTLLCFDQDFARSQGLPVMLLDLLLMSAVVLLTVVGLQAVGLILVIALLIIPPASARFWTHNLATMAWLSAGFGGLAGGVGALLSALAPRWPAGAVIVLANSLLFVLSFTFGSARGLLVRWRAHRRLNRKIARQHLLRALQEYTEEFGSESVPWSYVLAERSWTALALRREVERAQSDGLLKQQGEELRLTVAGLEQAARAVRNHRLWEMYLITHADIAPSHVDRDADMVEHVLEPALIAELEALMQLEEPIRSPHPLQGASS